MSRAWKCPKAITIPLRDGSKFRAEVVESRGVWVLHCTSAPNPISYINLCWFVVHGPSCTTIGPLDVWAKGAMMEEQARAKFEALANACPNLASNLKAGESFSDEDALIIRIAWRAARAA